MILWKDIFAKIPERQTKWNMFLPLFSFSSVRGGLGRRKSTRWERGAIRRKTTTTRTIKRDTCKEAGNKGRPNKNNIGHEEKDTQEKENKQEEGKRKTTHTHTHTRTRRHTTQKRGKTTGTEKMKKEKGMMKWESEAEAPTKKNKHNQEKHRKFDQNHEKNSSTYCTRKVQSLKW